MHGSAAPHCMCSHRIIPCVGYPHCRPQVVPCVAYPHSPAQNSSWHGVRGSIQRQTCCRPFRRMHVRTNVPVSARLSVVPCKPNQAMFDWQTTPYVCNHVRKQHRHDTAWPDHTAQYPVASQPPFKPTKHLPTGPAGSSLSDQAVALDTPRPSSSVSCDPKPQQPWATRIKKPPPVSNLLCVWCSRVRSAVCCCREAARVGCSAEKGGTAQPVTAPHAQKPMNTPKHNLNFAQTYPRPPEGGRPL